MTTQYKCIKCGMDYEPNEFTREDDMFTWDDDDRLLVRDAVNASHWYIKTTCMACTELARLRLVDIKRGVERQRRFDPYYKAVGYGIVLLFLFFIFVYQWIPGAPGVGY